MKREISLFDEFVDEWNKTHSERLKKMSEFVAVATGDKELWVAEDHAFEVEVKHYILRDTNYYN